MRKNILYITGLLFIVAALTAALFAMNGRAVAQTGAGESDKTMPRVLTVTGNGKAYLTPDIVYINIGVHTENPDAAEAVASNNAQSQKVVDALKGFEIQAKDIQTTNFSIYPQQQFDQFGKVTGITYVVDNTVFVTLRDMTKVGGALDAAVKAGANSINSIQFDAEDKSKALSEARKAAVVDARTQADELSQAAGVKLGTIQSISVYGGSVPMPLYEAKGVGGAGLAASVPIATGQLVISMDVNIVYNIE